MLDVKKVRSEFNIFNVEKDMVYLDSGATSLTPDCVVDKMTDYYKNYRATVHRTMYKTGIKADGAYNEAREVISDFINASDSSEIIFSKSVTTALNSLARALVGNLNQGDEILISELEHHSNLLHWREFAKEKGVVPVYIPIDNLEITLENIKKVVTSKTKIIAINHISNVIGAKTNIKEIGEYCLSNKITLVVDGAQTVAHDPVDVKELNVDFYAFTGHKMFGPTGIGVLYGKKEKLEPLLFDLGGDMAFRVTKDGVTPTEKPVALEAGTPAIAEVIGLGEAVKFINRLGIENIQKYVYEIRQKALDELLKIEDITIYNKDIQSTIITFNIKNIAAHDALQHYANNEVCIRGGHMCNQLTLGLLEEQAVLRASFNVFNNDEDVIKFVETTKSLNVDNILDDMF